MVRWSPLPKSPQLQNGFRKHVMQWGFRGQSLRMMEVLFPFNRLNGLDCPNWPEKLQALEITRTILWKLDLNSRLSLSVKNISCVSWISPFHPCVFLEYVNVHCTHLFRCGNFLFTPASFGYIFAVWIGALKVSLREVRSLFRLFYVHASVSQAKVWLVFKSIHCMKPIKLLSE